MSQHRRGSVHGASPVPGHPPANNLPISAHEIQTRGIPLPGMVPSRSIHGSPMHGNPIHGFVNPLGPAGIVHPPPTHPTALVSGISHRPGETAHQGIGTPALIGSFRDTRKTTGLYLFYPLLSILFGPLSILLSLENCPREIYWPKGNVTNGLVTLHFRSIDR